MAFQFRALPLAATALLLLMLPLDSSGFGVQIVSFQSPTQSILRSFGSKTRGSSRVRGTPSTVGQGDNWCLFGSNGKGEDDNDIFSLYCEPDGFMTKDTLTKVPMIAEMLADGDLTEAELSDFWTKVPKYPDNNDNKNDAVENNKINADSFLQIYRGINDLFVEVVGDGDDDDDAMPITDASAAAASASLDSDSVGNDNDEMELQKIFAQICNTDADDAKLLSKDGLREWDEIARLLDDGLLGMDEFETLWSRAATQASGTTTTTTTTDMLDVNGFLRFNALLDDLFVFDADDLDADSDDDDDDEDDDIDEEPGQAQKPPRSQVSGDDLPPGVLFSALANDDYLVGPSELQLWTELQTMLRDGDLLAQELQALFTSNAVNTNGGSYLTEDSFISFYESLDALFEDAQDEVSAEALEAKIALLEFLEELNDDAERLVCGLEADERQEEIVQNIVAALERNDAANVIKKTKGDIQPADLVGDWKLLYSSSAAMKFNKGLSGIGGSFPNGKFGGLTQSLEYAKFRQDVVYKEQIDVTPQAASFQVEVNGAWELRKSISLFTNRPCTMLSVEPNAVKYGPTNTRGDHWKSLGPMNLLDVTYLDEDLRIMRGNTASDAIFVWQRIR